MNLSRFWDNMICLIQILKVVSNFIKLFYLRVILFNFINQSNFIIKTRQNCIFKCHVYIIDN